MTRLLLLFTFCSFVSLVSAQENFRRYTIGAFAGITTNSSDLPKAGNETVFGGGAEIYLTKFLSGGMSFQKGKLSGSENRSTQRYFLNEFTAISFNSKVHLGQFIGRNKGRYQVNNEGLPKRVLKGIYLGTGGGLLNSSQSKIQRTPLAGAASYIYVGQNKNKELFIPAMLGLDIHTSQEPGLIFTVQYTMNFVLGDNMDGYLISGSKNDTFSTLSLGIKYAFGRLQLN
ncbi:hypothetical protein [Arcticibacter tournemirensis]|uniref:Outer membrane protein beta-barrel domain-containing protein n=1 Tax=Arcticibacter tournemirensis TaxID=699437 RepID=A0A4Q0MBP2_9SPHI|nr:hypothetical protein [Arcticibacter tournemirensis]RXF70731.1 hypothetical protein EKH83_08830 [Arcticibacter tournemirensis]